MTNAEIGEIGENIAYKYLLNRQYLILARNHREKSWEIDIICRNKSGILIFCEIKTLNNNGGFKPEDNLSKGKHIKMIRAARLVLAKYPNLIYDNAGWQLDLIAIELINGKLSTLRHYDNI